MAREQRTKEKADHLFIIYQQMGADRSINRLFTVCQAVGVKTSESSLHKYSQRFEWQRRLLELQSAEAERREQDVSKQVDDMNRQDALMAQGMKAMVLGGIRYHHDQMKTKAAERIRQGLTGDQILDMDFKDIAYLGRSAQQIERLARGQATSRTEVWVDVASTVVREFVLIFAAVNGLSTPEEREREFDRLGDEMMTRLYSETTRRMLDSGNGKNGH
jgi:hypothetical protein